MSSLLNLKKLDLSYNNLTEIKSDDFIFKVKEAYVDLSHNQIKTIDISSDETSYETLKTTIVLNENPVHCGCRLLDFVKFLKKELNFQDKTNKNLLLETDDLNCFSPTHLIARNVNGLHLSELSCPNFELDYE